MTSCSSSANGFDGSATAARQSGVCQMSLRFGGKDYSLVGSLDSNYMLVNKSVSFEGVLAGDVVRLAGQRRSKTFDDEAGVLANNRPLQFRRHHLANL